MIETTLKPSDKGRAWIEVDLGALAYNVKYIRSQLATDCEIMAVVKADAYGHGAEIIAKRLWAEGIKSFAVATVSEAVNLRQQGLDGEILIMGYTSPQDARFLCNYRLTQLIIDGEYAKALDETCYQIRAHVALDTGMHREGIPVTDMQGIERVFLYKNLIIEGVSTHLASSDSLGDDDVGFTQLQTKRFFSAVSELKRKGYEPGKTHIQASYGALNHPTIKCDYIRIGIGLYGVLSHDAQTLIKPDLRPVLSLKSVVAQVRRIEAGESVSYGRTYTADRPVNLATISIGYADGVPRQMSGNHGLCIVGGYKAPIVGRICMDMLMADVTCAGPVMPGDIVTMIGKDGGEEIRCEEFAIASGTISNDALCRLGGRLPRVYVES